MGANADTVKSGWDAFADGDMDAAVSTTSDQAKIVIPESLPWGGTYTGPAGFKEMIGKFVSNFDEVHPEPQQFLEADDGHVLVTVSGVGTDEERQRARRRLDLALQGRRRRDLPRRVLRRHRDRGKGARLADAFDGLKGSVSRRRSGSRSRYPTAICAKVVG